MLPQILQATFGALRATRGAHRMASEIAYPPIERPIPEARPSPRRSVLPRVFDDVTEREICPMNNIYTALAFLVP